jgi:hypothetical protein
MSEPRFPSHHELRQAILSILRDSPTGMRISEIDVKLVELLDIPEVLAIKIHEGKRTEISYRSAWARSQLKKRGLIVKDELGIFHIAKPE